MYYFRYMLLYIGILANVILIFGGIGWCLLGYNNVFMNWVIESMTARATAAGMKENIQGERIYVKRENKRSVRVNLYRAPEANRPVIFVAHGGNFYDHDADDIDDFCIALSEKMNMSVVAVSYTKVDVHVTSYPQEEIGDVIRYFADHAGIFDMDMENYIMMGIEAGAYLSLISGVHMTQKAFFAKAYVFINPFLDYVPISFAQAGWHPEPVLLLFTNEDSGEKAEEYQDVLARADVYAKLRRRIDPEHPLRFFGESYKQEKEAYEEHLDWIKENLDMILR